jgi:hypothetical protein
MFYFYKFMFKVCMFYILFVHRYTTGLVLDHLTLVLQTHFDPGGHAVGQLLEQRQGKVPDPHRLDHPLRLGQGGDGVISFQPRPHNGPHMLNRIEIQGISGPVHHCEGLLPEQGHGDLARVAGDPILQELGHPIFILGGRKNREPLPFFAEKHPHSITLRECFTFVTTYFCL